MRKIVSFQIVQGYNYGDRSAWSPDIVALCEDGHMYTISLQSFYDGGAEWKRMTPNPSSFSNIIESAPTNFNENTDP